MKKLIILVIITSMLGACNKLVEDLNDNPNSPTSAPYENILTGVELGNTIFQCGEATRKAGIFCGYYTGTDRSHLGYSTYGVVTSNFNTQWNDVFVKTIAHIVTANEAAVKEGKSGVTTGIIKVIKALSLGETTALWEDIPFDEAGDFEIENPIFEDQISVYAKIQDLLDEAIIDLESGTGRPASNADIHFDGVVASWVEVAYTLKARFYIHTKEYSNAYAAALNGISSSANNLVTPHGDADDNSNLNYQFFELSARKSDLIVSDFMTSLVAPNAGVSPDFSKYRGNTKTNETGRYNYLFQVTSYGTQPNTSDGFAAQEEPSIMVSYRENLLILAEAGCRTVDMATGLAHLNEFRTYMDDGGYLSNVDTATIQYEPYDLTDFEAGGIENSDGINQGDALLREILEERYVSLFGSLEGFNDTRRTEKETSVRVPVQPNTGDQLPQRFLYPESEIDRNSNVPNPVPGFFEPTKVNQ